MICRRLFALLLFVATLTLPKLNAQEFLPSKNDFKITLLSLGSGSSRFTYERAFSPKNSAELTLGVISWGWDIMNHANPNGLLVKAAYKWLLLPQRNADSWLAGFYVKPELVFANYNYFINPEDSGLPASSGSLENHTKQVALMAEGGYQLVLKWFVFDIYAGTGPTFGTGNFHNYYHSFMRFPTDGLLAFTSGFRLGVAF